MDANTTQLTRTDQCSVRCPWRSLTTHEISVARLVGEALTNHQIASRLHISPHTVNFHLRRIYSKIEIHSRVRLAQIVQDHTGISQCRP